MMSFKKAPDISVLRYDDGPYKVCATVYNLSCTEAAELMDLLDTFYDTIRRKAKT